MWKLVYNLLICSLLPFFATYSLTNRKIRKNFLERMFPSAVRADLNEPLWIHAASVGEGVIAQNLVAYARKKVQNDFVITTNTYYTRDMLRKKLGGTVHVYSLPFDVRRAVRRFIGSSRFSALLLIETEIWPNLIWTAKGRKIPVVIVNGRISDATIGRYRRLSFFLKNVLASVDLVLAQSPEQARRFISLGVSPLKVVDTGNLKYYRDLGEGHVPEKEHCVTFGSIKEKEIPLLIPVIERLRHEFPGLRLYIVPRELHLTDALEDRFRGRITRYSLVKQGSAVESDIVLVDTVGDLMDIYARSKAAFVGGSLAPYGGQNMLEPLFVGTPVVFGPYTANFKDAARNIIDRHAGIMVPSADELFPALKQILTDEGFRRQLVEAGNTVLEAQKQAMEKTVQHVMEIMCRNSTSSSN